MNNKKIIIVFVLIVLVGETLYYFSTKKDNPHDGCEVSQEEIKQKELPHPIQEAEIIVKTFPTKKGWGYNITIDGTEYISQTHKSAAGGDQGFSTQEDARKVGNLAAEKIRQGLFPPSISVEELDSLGIMG